MLAGITYDLRDHYRALGFPEEEVAEFDSILTINAIDDALRKLGFETDRIGTVTQLAERLVSGSKWDFIFNIAEGVYGIGREAQVPALCDAYKIPYTFSDPCVLSLTLNKELTKRVVRDLGLATPDFRLVRNPAEIDDVNMPFPLFAKPYAEGTGKGINAHSIINNQKSLKKVCKELLAAHKQPVLVESYLSGREFTVGILGTGPESQIIGVLEVILRDKAETGVYSYLNKEKSEELVEYKLADDNISSAAAELALKSWKGIGCFDGGRVDIRCDGKGKPYFLEVNPLAGLQPIHSDLPMICEKSGISYTDMIGSIVKSALSRYGLLEKAPAALKTVKIHSFRPAVPKKKTLKR